MWLFNRKYLKRQSTEHQANENTKHGLIRDLEKSRNAESAVRVNNDRLNNRVEELTEECKNKNLTDKKLRALESKYRVKTTYYTDKLNQSAEVDKQTRAECNTKIKYLKQTVNELQTDKAKLKADKAKADKQSATTIEKFKNLRNAYFHVAI
jgi:chromosome segregation ATPase